MYLVDVAPFSVLKTSPNSEVVCISSIFIISSILLPSYGQIDSLIFNSACCNIIYDFMFSIYDFKIRG